MHETKQKHTIQGENEVQQINKMIFISIFFQNSKEKKGFDRQNRLQFKPIHFYRLECMLLGSLSVHIFHSNVIKFMFECLQNEPFEKKKKKKKNGIWKIALIANKF